MSQSTPSEHDKRRDFWLVENAPGVVSTVWPGKYEHQYIHVREVRPGEITLTKERMQQIWEQQSDREWETPGEAFGRFLAELFSEGTQASQVE